MQLPEGYQRSQVRCLEMLLGGIDLWITTVMRKGAEGACANS